MRKLASIKQISAIHPIEGKDRIGLAIVDGWQVIVQKADYQPGDLCVFCEIDSVLPEKPEFEFLRSKNFRIRTMKMAGVISQGICFPLSILPPKKHGEYKLEEDVTEVIGVTQYEPTQDKEPAPAQKKTKWPQWLMRFKLFRRMVLPKRRKGGSLPLSARRMKLASRTFPTLWRTNASGSPRKRSMDKAARLPWYAIAVLGPSGISMNTSSAPVTCALAAPTTPPTGRCPSGIRLKTCFTT